MKRFRRFTREDKGATTVEFVVVMTFFVVFAFFTLEVALAQFWWMTAVKAVQIGTRLAVVSDPAVTAISSSTTNPAKNGNFGLACPTNCDFSSFAGCSATSCTWTCAGGTGAGCNATAFNYIVTRMKQMEIPIQNSNVTIVYRYVGMGYAGGPLTPAVTVTLSGVPFNTGFAPIIGNMLRGSGTNTLTTIPTISITLTGEDLNHSQSS